MLPGGSGIWKRSERMGRDDRGNLGWCLWSQKSVNKSREVGRAPSNESFWVELRVSKDHKDKGKKVG